MMLLVMLLDQLASEEAAVALELGKGQEPLLLKTSRPV